MRLAVIVILCVALGAMLTACGGLPRAPGGDSPSTAGGSSTAAQLQAAQNVGRDQGQAETPLTNTTGTATNMFKFASEGVDPAIGMALIEIARDQKWSAEALASIFKSMNGAPENVDIKIDGGIQAQSGDGENVGSSGGTGGNTGMRDTGNPDNR